MIGTTISPTERPAVAQQNNWREVDFELLWTPGQEIADRILAMIKHELSSRFVRGSWYEVDHRRVITAVRRIAELCHVELFTTEERVKRLVQIATRYAQNQQVLERDNSPTAVRRPQNVVSFPDRRRQLETVT